MKHFSIWNNKDYKDLYSYWFGYGNFKPRGFEHKTIETEDINYDTKFLVIVSLGNLEAYIGKNESKVFLDYVEDKVLDFIRNGSGYRVILMVKNNMIIFVKRCQH